MLSMPAADPVPFSHRDRPRGEPAVYKLVTRRVTYLWGGVETVTYKKPSEEFPSNIATGSSEGIILCLSFNHDEALVRATVPWR